MKPLSASKLRKIFRYDTDTGLFWNLATNKRAGGDKTNDGYLRISIDSCAYRAHRLAWLYVHGVWPNLIDHINGDRTDNRLCNLREVSRSQNSWNSTHSRKTISGLKGVHYRAESKKYRARIVINGKLVTLGHFNTPQEAQQAYLEQAKKVHGSFFRGPHE